MKYLPYRHQHDGPHPWVNIRTNPITGIIDDKTILPIPLRNRSRRQSPCLCIVLAVISSPALARVDHQQTGQQRDQKKQK